MAADIIAAVLAAIFLAVGSAKVLRAPKLVGEFERFGYPNWFRISTGACEVIGAGLLIAGMIAMAAGIAGALSLICVMLGALYTHGRVGDSADKFAPPLVLLLLLCAEVALLASN